MIRLQSLRPFSFEIHLKISHSTCSGESVERFRLLSLRPFI